MISTISWIKKGIAKEAPVKYELNDEEYQRIAQLAGERYMQVKEVGLSDEEYMQGSDEELPNQESNQDLMEESDQEDEQLQLFGNISSHVVYKDNTQDPYILVKEDDEVTH